MNGTKPYVLGLTGSIGTGKSTTAQMFRDAGVPVWDADQTVHDLYTKDAALVAAIADIVPTAVAKDKVDRDLLKSAIKSKPEILSRIEAVVHPRVAEERAEFISAANADIILLDIPLLFEVGADKVCDGVLVVTTTPDEQRRRVVARGTMSAETLDLILSRQLPLAEKVRMATFVIETNSLEQTRKDVHDLIDRILNRDISDA